MCVRCEECGRGCTILTFWGGWGTRNMICITYCYSVYNNYPVRARMRVGVCVSFSVCVYNVVSTKNELFERTRHFYGLL